MTGLTLERFLLRIALPPVRLGLYMKRLEARRADPAAAAVANDELRRAYEAGGPKAYWQKTLEWAKEEPPEGPYDIAKLYARLGEKQSAFDYLDLAFQKRDVQLVLGLKTDRAFDKFRGEPEFTALLRRMKWE